MIVVDTDVLIDALRGRPDDPALRRGSGREVGRGAADARGRGRGDRHGGVPDRRDLPVSLRPPPHPQPGAFRPRAGPEPRDAPRPPRLRLSRPHRPWKGEATPGRRVISRAFSLSQSSWRKPSLRRPTVWSLPRGLRRTVRSTSPRSDGHASDPSTRPGRASSSRLARAVPLRQPQVGDGVEERVPAGGGEGALGQAAAPCHSYHFRFE